MNKGQGDPLSLIFLVFGVIIVLFASIIVYQGFLSATSDTVITGIALDILEKQENVYLVMDYMMLFLTVGCLVALFISGYFIQSHPIFLGVSILLAIFDTIVAAMLSNAYVTLSGTYPLIGPLIPISTWIAQRFPIILVVGVVLFGLGLYTKPANPGGGGSYGY